MRAFFALFVVGGLIWFLSTLGPGMLQSVPVKIGMGNYGGALTTVAIVVGIVIFLKLVLGGKS